MIQRQAKKAVASEMKVASQFGGQSSSGEEDKKPLSPMSGKSLEPRKPMIVRQKQGVGNESRKEPESDKNAKKTDEKTNDSHSSCSRTSCNMSGTDESNKLWEDKSNQGVKGEKALKPVNKNFKWALDVHTHRLHRQSQKYNGKISAKISR